MLLKAYRVTDRLGTLFVKILEYTLSSAALALNRVLRAVWMIAAGSLALVAGVLRALLRLLRSLGRGITRGFTLLLRLVMRGATQSTSRAIRGVGGTATGAMARRAARQNIDVRLAEDPLKTQNRRLSFVVMLMGFAIIAVILWATDPARTAAPVPVAGSGLGLLGAQSTQQPSPEPQSLGLPTPIPIATQVPVALRGGGTMAYTVREQGQTDLFLAAVIGRQTVRITNHSGDERDPAWNPDGTRLAYAAQTDGNWEIYVYDLPTQETARITYDLSFQGNPTWSPDGLFLAYESYQGNNLDIYAVPIDGSAPASRITDNAAPDYAPAWAPDGRRIAFVSLRDRNQDIYIFNLDTLETTNLTNTPLLNEDSPVWSPDGRWLAYSAWENGAEKIFVMSEAGGAPQVINFGRTPGWSPDGLSISFVVDAVDGAQSYLYAVPFGGATGATTEIISVPYGSRDVAWSAQAIPPVLLNSGGLPLGVEPLFVEQAERSNTGAPYRLSPLPDVLAPNPVLSDLVNDSFNAMRRQVVARSGVDFFGTLDDAFWDLERLPNPGEPRRSWHMTGRAIAFQRSSLLGFPPQIEVMRQEVGVNTLWRIFLRVDQAAQSGQLGEPLRALPWDFLSATQGDVEAYNQGGRFRAEVPTGYYIDLTQLAADFGWLPMPAGSDWRANVATRNFWLYYKPEGLVWCDAMLQLYTAGEMINFCGSGS